MNTHATSPPATTTDPGPTPRPWDRGRAGDVLTGRNSRDGAWLLPLGTLVMGFLWLFVTNDVFRSPENLSNVVTQAVPLLIVAIGQMIVVLIGGLDLSVGSVVSLTTVVLAEGGTPLALIPLVFVSAAMVGAANGLVVTRLNVHPIIATLSMSWIVLGVARWIRPIAGGDIPPFVKGLVINDRAFVWLVVLLAVAWKLIHGSRFGLHLFAIGGGLASGHPDAARTFGVPDRRNVVLAYVASAVFAAAAGIFLAGRIVSGDAEVGAGLEIASITAVALGGTQLSGGIGSLQGTLIGAAAFALIANGMNLENVNPFIQTIITGTILLFVVVSQRRKQIGL